MPSAREQQVYDQLIALGDQLLAVLKTQDWDSVSRIDLRIRDCLQTLAELDNPAPGLLEAKSQLKQLYERVIPAYGEACEKLRVLLLNHIDHAEGRSAYLRTDLLQGGK